MEVRKLKKSIIVSSYLKSCYRFAGILALWKLWFLSGRAFLSMAEYRSKTTRGLLKKRLAEMFKVSDWNNNFQIWNDWGQRTVGAEKAHALPQYQQHVECSRAFLDLWSKNKDSVFDRIVTRDELGSSLNMSWNKTRCSGIKRMQHHSRSLRYHNRSVNSLQMFFGTL